MRRLIYILFLCFGFLVSHLGTTQAISNEHNTLGIKQVPQNEPLYFSDALQQNDAGLVAGHYSHRSHGSHGSHTSHTSSRY